MRFDVMRRTHFDKKPRRVLLPTTVTVGPAQNQAFLRTRDRHKAVAPFFFHFRAGIALLATLLEWHDIFRQPDHMNDVKFSTLGAVNCHQSDGTGLGRRFLRAQSKLLKELIGWRVAANVPRNIPGNLLPG